MSLPVAPPYPSPEGRWTYRRSLASRVILLTTVAVGLAVAFVAAGAYITVRMQLQTSLDDSLRERAHGAAEYDVLARSEVPPSVLGAADVRMAYVRSDGFVFTLDRMDPLPLGKPEVEVARGKADDSVRTLRAGTEDYRVVAVPTNINDTSLVIAQSLEQQQNVLARLGLVMLGFGVVGVVVAGFAGWLVARNGLRPVRRLTSSVEAKARTEDLRPLPVEGDDEVARLASAFNEMLTALDASRERQRTLVADAGHELRTPLTSLRTNIDLLTQSDLAGGPTLDPEARAEVLDDIRAQIDELTTLIGDLTELARADPATSVVEELELSEIVHQAFNRVRLRAPGLSFDVVAHPWWVTGDAAALERAVTNLLDNAAKWSPPGGRVSCRLVDGELTIEDDGPGIAEADRPHVFDRFWRATESRTMPGSGLGLSIVRQVADRHSGTVEVGSSASGGARLILAIPGSARPATTPVSTVVEVRSVLAASIVTVLLAACSGDDQPTASPTATPTTATWNPCDALDLGEVSAWLGGEFTKDAGTPEAPACTFSPGAEGGPVVNANYMLFPEGLDAVFETMSGLDPDDIRPVQVAGADAARVVVDFDDQQLFVSGFVQNGDLIQTVDVVDPRPYDEARVVRGVRSILTAFSAAAP